MRVESDCRISLVSIWVVAATILTAGEARGQDEAPLAKRPEITPNTWMPVQIDATLPPDLNGARWVTGDGYSNSVYRAKTATVLIRTGIDCKAAGLSPGYYTNTTVEWNLASDKAAVLEFANWGGGSYGKGRLLAAFKEHATPSPRHTYDGICYVEKEDAVYVMLGANWKTCLGEEVDPDAKTALALDDNSTWRYSFADQRWTRIDGSIRQFWNLNQASSFESHLRHWPAGDKLLYLNSKGDCHAEFDLKSRSWQKIELKGKAPMSLYEARSAWDSRRGLWVFRHGPQACTFDPANREFKALPDMFPLPEDPKDPRRRWQGIVYNPKHDVYFTSGATGDDTWVYHPEKRAWTNLRCGATPLRDWAYLQYDSATDLTLWSFQFRAFKFRYVP